ncbi:MAG: mechanosensitive ion channel [Polyangiales bacterium]
MDESIADPASAGGNVLEAVSRIHLGGILGALSVLVLTWATVRILDGLLRKLTERLPNRRLQLNLLATTVRFAVWAMGSVLAVLALDLSREFVLTLTGAAAVTVGLALKDLASSVLAGLTIVIDRPFQVGDRVKFQDYYGEIVEIGLRSVRLVTLDDNLVTIPNNMFLTEVTASGNAGALDMMIQVDFEIAHDADVELARSLVSECLVSNPYAYLKKRWGVYATQTQREGWVGFQLRAKAYVLDVQFEKEFENFLVLSVAEQFRKHAIPIPSEG